MEKLSTRFDPRLFILDAATLNIRFSQAGRKHYSLVLAPLGRSLDSIKRLPDLVAAFRQLHQIELQDLMVSTGGISLLSVPATTTDASAINKAATPALAVVANRNAPDKVQGVE
jgi:hypothetical protein